MSIRQFISAAAFATILGFGASLASAQITIPTVPIGHPGNAPDSTGYGSVAYTYNIGTTEVTNAQYAAFLNAVAATDANDLYNTNMAGSFGAITRSGSAGSYTYATVSGRANNPVNWVSFWDATRFANWLNNGQPSGIQDNSTTENGTYTLTPSGITANTITRNSAWRWAVTSENEWFKAAYHHPAAQGGDGDNYWLYPTSSNTISTSQANYNQPPSGSVTSVGSYAANFYGTFDMGGNVWEWDEAIINGSSRGLRGAAFNNDANSMRADVRIAYAFMPPANAAFGFRVSQVPAPSSVALLAIGGLGALRRRRGFGR